MELESNTFFTGIPRRLWTTQLFTYLGTDSAMPLFTFCEMIDLPDHQKWDL